MRKVECDKVTYNVDERRIRTKVETKVVGIFLGWGSEYEEFEAGPGNYTVALVEMPDGTVDTFLPRGIRFLPESNLVWKDHLHRDYTHSDDTVKFDTGGRMPPGKTVHGL